MSKSARGLRVFNIKIADLTADPQNARNHDARNIAAIRKSLERFGQQKPIVVSDTGVVIAGNGTLVAARELGWKSIEAVRSSLKGDDATAYAIADNRTGELAEWNDEALRAQIEALCAVDASMLDAIGFTAADLASGGDESRSTVEMPMISYRVIALCKNEHEQAALFERLRAEGFDCQLLMS